jgi:hypothetical protein
MRLDEPLTIDAPASSRLLKTLPRIMAVYHKWDPMFRVTEVRTLGTSKLTDTDSASRNRALFFSCGIDSFYALSKLVELPEKNKLTHLIFVHGFDIKLDDNSLFERAWRAAEEVASHYEKKLVVVTTNVRTITDQYLSWDYCCGGTLASVALCLGGFFGTIYIASDLGPDETAPLAIHPDLDPFWSTETSTFVHYSYGISRVKKARALASNIMAQKHLRVCWKNTDGVYNCGKCSKCVRTMIALHLAGALSKFNFPTTLTPELVERIDYNPDPSVITHADQIVIELQREGESQLALSLSHAVRKTYLRRRLETLKVWLLKKIWVRRVLFDPS